MTNEMHDKMLERVRALLAKAESTTHPEEAKAFSAKAQELMSKYAIDAAMLDAASGRQTHFGQRRVDIGTKYTRATFTLFGQVAVANDCTLMVDGDIRKYCWIAGAESDMEATEMLYTSLRLQASREILSMVAPPGVSTTTFRNSFLYGYADEIGMRLVKARIAAREAAETQYAHTGASVALVLANKRDAVTQWLVDNKVIVPPEKAKKSSLNKPTIDGSGYRAGVEAGARADIGGRRVGAKTPVGELR